MRWISSHLFLSFTLFLIFFCTDSLSNAQLSPSTDQGNAVDDESTLESLKSGLIDAVKEVIPTKQTQNVAAGAKPETPAAPAKVATANVVEKDSKSGDPEKQGTVFNGQQVPPLTELSGKTYKEEIAEGYWFVDAFSPYCHHCKSLAPKLHTLYEFYYTSNPLPASSASEDLDASLNTFSRYYDFHFATLDCVAFGTSCSELKVASFPTIMLFKDGTEIKKTTGDRSIQDLSKFIEECLEIIRPGSRPVGGIKELPKVGMHEFKSITPATSGDTSARSSVDQTGADAVAIAGPGLIAPKKPTMARHEPNPDGKSVALTPETFNKLVHGSLNPWFIKFHTPWCGHCQALAPSWAGMAREMQGKLDIGEINCEQFKGICRAEGVRGFPTLMYYRGPEHVEYEGLRGVGDLIKYADLAHKANTGVVDINAEDFEHLESTEPVIFLYFYDHATTSEDLMALERLPMHLIGRAKLFKTDDPKLIRRFKITTWPRLIVSRSGTVSQFDWLMPQELRNIAMVANWMRSVWLPLVPELTAQNAREILNGKFAVLGILNRDRPEEMAISLRELRNAATDWNERQQMAVMLERQELRDAKQLRIEEAEDRNDQRALRDAKLIRIDMNDIRRKEVRFAWVDGIFWERWIRTTFGTTVRDGERVIVNDEDNHRYWAQTITGNPIVPSRTSILETLPKIISSPPKLTPKPNGSRVRVALYRIRTTVTRHRNLILGALLFGVLAFAVMWFRSWRRSGSATTNGRNGKFGNTQGFFQLGGDPGGRLLGGGLPNGKAD